MTGFATSETRSAIVAETTVGTTPSTPGFSTMHDLVRMSSKPDVFYGQSLTGKGARTGQGYGIDMVEGTYEGPLYYGAADELLSTLLQADWATNVLKDAKKEQSVTVENTVNAGVGGTATMTRFRGVEAISGSINLQAEREAQISLNLMGRGSDNATTSAITGATYTDPSVVDPLVSGQDVGTIKFAGYALDCMQSLEIAFDFEQRDRQPKLSSKKICGIRRGNFLPKLTANIYIETNFLNIYNAARKRHNSFAVTVPIGSVTGEKYTVLFPVCHFGSTELDLSAGDAMQKVEIMPHYDSSKEKAVIKITRAVS